MPVNKRKTSADVNKRTKEKRYRYDKFKETSFCAGRGQFKAVPEHGKPYLPDMQIPAKESETLFNSGLSRFGNNDQFITLYCKSTQI